MTEDLSFKSGMDSSGFHAGIRGMVSGANKAAGEISSAFKRASGDIQTAFGAGAVVAGIAAVAKAGDDVALSIARINAATGDMGQAQQVFDQLRGLAEQTGVSANESAGAFTRFAIAARQIGASNDDVVRLIETIQKAGIVSGASTQELASASQQLGQALASGRFQGDELRSVMENLPILAETLAKELGVGIGELREMGKEGELTADKVFKALLSGSDELNAKFEKMPVTMGRAWDRMKNSAIKALSEIDDYIGASRGLSKIFGATADFLGGEDVITTDLRKGSVIPGLNAPLPPDTLKPFSDPKADKAAEKFNKEMEQIAKDRVKLEEDFNDALDRELQKTVKYERDQQEKVEKAAEGIEALHRALKEGAADVREQLRTLISSKRGELANAISDRANALNNATNFGLLGADDKRQAVRDFRDFQREQNRQERIARKGIIRDDRGKERTADSRFGSRLPGKGAREVILADASIRALAIEIDKLVAAQGAL